jgi:hypothetical protein
VGSSSKVGESRVDCVARVVEASDMSSNKGFAVTGHFVDKRGLTLRCSLGTTRRTSSSSLMGLLIRSEELLL